MAIEKEKFKNVVILLLDAFNVDYLKSDSEQRQFIPNIAHLADNGIWYKNVFVGGAPTQMALPVLFTSSYPLDYGGYGEGIKYRPKSITEIFKDNGYNTFSVMTASGGGCCFGYDRGFDEYLELFDLRSYVAYFIKYQYGFRKVLIDSGRLKKNKAVESLQKLTNNFFVSLEKTLDNYEAYWSKFGYDVYNPCNIDFLKKIVSKEVDKFHGNQINYVLSLLEGKKNILFDYFASLKAHPINSKQAIDILLKKIMNKDEKIFAYMHLLDIHDSKTFDYYGASSNQDLKNILFNTWDQVNLSLTDHEDNDKINDLITTVYVDYQIGRLIRALEENGVLDDTLLVVLNDHGKVDQSRLERSNIGFWDELARMNIIFYNTKYNAKESNSLFSAIDFPPTLLDIVGIKEESTFQGKIMSCNDKSASDYVLYESLGKGTCDFSVKPILVCVRSEKMKVICRESDWYWLLGMYSKPKVYDLVNDPSEKKPLRRRDFLRSDEYGKLSHIAKTRCKQIRSKHKYKISFMHMLWWNFKKLIGADT